jgi:hypothetical protein
MLPGLKNHLSVETLIKTMNCTSTSESIKKKQNLAKTNYGKSLSGSDHLQRILSLLENRTGMDFVQGKNLRIDSTCSLAPIFGQQKEVSADLSTCVAALHQP